MAIDHYAEVREVFRRFPKFSFDTSDVHLFLPWEAQDAISKDSIRRQLRKLLSNREIEANPKRGKGKYKLRKVATPPPPPEPEVETRPEPKTPHLPVASPHDFYEPDHRPPPPPVATPSMTPAIPPPPIPEEADKPAEKPKDDHFLAWLRDGKSFDRGPGRP